MLTGPFLVYIVDRTSHIADSLLLLDGRGSRSFNLIEDKKAHRRGALVRAEMPLVDDLGNQRAGVVRELLLGIDHRDGDGALKHIRKARKRMFVNRQAGARRDGELRQRDM